MVGILDNRIDVFTQSRVYYMVSFSISEKTFQQKYLA